MAQAGGGAERHAARLRQQPVHAHQVAVADPADQLRHGGPGVAAAGGQQVAVELAGLGRVELGPDGDGRRRGDLAPGPQPVEQLVGREAPPPAQAVDHGGDIGRAEQVDQLGQSVAGRDDGQVPPGQHVVAGEAATVVGHQQVGLGRHGRHQRMQALGVVAGEAGGQRLVGRGHLPQRERAPQRVAQVLRGLRRPAQLVDQEGAQLVEHAVAPPELDQPGLGQGQEHVAHLGVDQHARVEEDPQPPHSARRHGRPPAGPRGPRG